MNAYTIQQVADLLQCSPVTVGRYVRRGWLDATKAGDRRNGPVEISAESVNRFIAERDDALTYDTATAARVLRCTQRTVQRLIGAGVLETSPVPGRAQRVKAESVTRLAGTWSPRNVRRRVAA